MELKKRGHFVYHKREKKSIRTGLTGSWSGIRYVYQRTGSLGQGLVVDCVGHCGGLLLLSVSKVIISQ